MIITRSINKYLYVTVNTLTKYFGRRRPVKYPQTEMVDSVDEIRHPIIREAMKITGVTDRVEITSMADIPAGTGLGSSSAYAWGCFTSCTRSRVNLCLPKNRPVKLAKSK
jgi:D-glycero-alpha-D-manno-heptose-7-phosphate kinase